MSQDPHKSFDQKLSQYIERERQRQPSAKMVERWSSPGFQHKEPAEEKPGSWVWVYAVVGGVAALVVLLWSFSPDTPKLGAPKKAPRIPSLPPATYSPKAPLKRLLTPTPARKKKKRKCQRSRLEHLKYAEPQLPTSLNPLFVRTRAGLRLSQLLFEPLVRQQPWSGKYIPRLAASWTLGKRSVTFQLRAGAKWHDGRELHAKDVAFTLGVMPKHSDGFLRRSIHEVVRAVRIHGPKRIEVLFRRPVEEPLRWFRFPILPSSPLAPRRGDAFDRHPIGTGPYRFVRKRELLLPRIELARVKDHWSQPCFHPSRITLYPRSLNKLQTMVFRIGAMDIYPAYPTRIPKRLEASKATRLYPYSDLGWWYIGLNHKGILGDLQVRRALAYALDRDGLRQKHLGEGQTISGPFSPNQPHYNFKVHPRSQKLPKARRLLEAAGWLKSGDVRKKGAQTLHLRLVVSASQEHHRALVKELQQAFRSIGASVDAIWLSQKQWERRIFEQRDFELTLHRWEVGQPSSVKALFSTGGRLNYLNYSNPRVDALFRKLDLLSSPKARKPALMKLHQMLAKDLPYIFLWSRTQTAVFSRRFKRVQLFGWDFFGDMGGWRYGP